MSTRKNTPEHESSEFSFGVRELREAREKQQPLLRTRPPAPSGRENCGTDPYNTSGSFDRSRNWMRVGKR